MAIGSIEECALSHICTSHITHLRLSPAGEFDIQLQAASLRALFMLEMQWSFSFDAGPTPIVPSPLRHGDYYSAREPRGGRGGASGLQAARPPQNQPRPAWQMAVEQRSESPRHASTPLIRKGDWRWWSRWFVCCFPVLVAAEAEGRRERGSLLGVRRQDGVCLRARELQRGVRMRSILGADGKSQRLQTQARCVMRVTSDLSSIM